MAIAIGSPLGLVEALLVTAGVCERCEPIYQTEATFMED